MRKLLQLISLLALAALWLLTWQALHGSTPLPTRIPTHFDIAGNPNAWGSAGNSLFILPAVATAVFLLIGLVSLNPASFNYPVRITPQNRERLQSLALQLIACIQAESTILLAILQYSILQAFRAGHFSLNPFLIPIGVAVILLTTIGHIIAMRRTARPA
jgi:uncharacterized membrane protein